MSCPGFLRRLSRGVVRLIRAQGYAPVVAAFAWFFKFSRFGLAMRATAFDQQVAQSMGIDPLQFAMLIAVEGGRQAALMALSQEDILGFNNGTQIYELFHVRVGVEELVIPDLAGLEKAYCAYKATRRL